jgi:hypothetical protein
MTRRIIDAVRDLLAFPASGDDVHFHNDGLQGEPGACYDSRCARPRIDVA